MHTILLIALPSFLNYGNVMFHLLQNTECKGGKVYEIQEVALVLFQILVAIWNQDVDQCSQACLAFSCVAVNVFQLGEFDFTCEILGTMEGIIPAQGAACYTPLRRILFIN
ncbi:hypothetical protein X798_02951 [Onchocerca flexuosa]|uniref:Secreted protein n=1 Tax=Onchocerca flexuosa TaxID=387005 RepID=A0A238BZF2_9BILA|nr:hypothetical protein X798_02951 [Onchocerca flexuosa]